MGFNLKIDCNSKTGFFVNNDGISNIYFNEIRRIPILSEEEQNKLIEIFNNAPTKKEREDAKNKLVETNLRFVISIAKRLGTPETFLDLVSEGNIGLIKAIEKFKPNKECHLLTYALSWIVAYMQNYQITRLNAVVPPNALKLHNYVKSVTRDFFAENERNPTANEIADLVRKKFDFNITNLEDVELGRMISIEEKYSTTDEDDTVEESNIYISRTSSNNIQEDIEEEYVKHKLNFFLGKLDDRERFIVERCYGIGCERESFDTIGLHLTQELGGELCGERVRQIFNTAVSKMRRYKTMVKD